MDTMVNVITEKAEKLLPDLIDIRRYFHMHPELSYQEINTSGKIQEILSSHNIQFTTGWCKNGIVGILKGQDAASRIIALRADMDALPIFETNQVDYKSKSEGVMHACGHDMHMTSLLGAIMILNDLRDKWRGTVKFIFQPAEEKLPGGASEMIKEGVLKNPQPEVIIGQHVQPDLPVGQIGLSAGAFMASCDEIYITVKGKGGHAAQAHLCIDPIYISGQLLNALHGLISREKPSSIPSVLSFGNIVSQGGATNIIPDAVRIEGTFRSLDEKWRKEAHQRIRELSISLVKSLKGDCHVDIREGYPCLLNHSGKTNAMINLAQTYLGPGNVMLMEPRMTSEDFAWYSHEIPAVFYRTGVGQVPGVHTSSFDIDENSLKFSSGLMAYLAIKM